MRNKWWIVVLNWICKLDLREREKLNDRYQAIFSRSSCLFLESENERTRLASITSFTNRFFSSHTSAIWACFCMILSFQSLNSAPRTFKFEATRFIERVRRSCTWPYCVFRIDSWTSIRVSSFSIFFVIASKLRSFLNSTLAYTFFNRSSLAFSSFIRSSCFVCYLFSLFYIYFANKWIITISK